jgi:hypothetical protein
MSAPVSEWIVELIASGVDLYVATCDRKLEPESMLGMGVRVHPDRATVTAYLPEALAAATLANLKESPLITLTMNRPSDHKAIQLKGRAVDIRKSNDVDRELQAIFRAALIEQFELVGVPRSLTRRFVWWPSIAVDVRITDVFAQTPGPGAGEPISAR